MGSSRMPWKRQESCIWTQCFTKNVIRYGLDQVMFHSSTMRKSRYERPSPQLTSPVSTVTDLSPHFRFEKQIKTVQTWCFCTKKKNDWSWGLLMENLKYWLLIGRANLISTNGLSFTVCSQPFETGFKMKCCVKALLCYLKLNWNSNKALLKEWSSERVYFVSRKQIAFKTF